MDEIADLLATIVGPDEAHSLFFFTSLDNKTTTTTITTLDSNNTNNNDNRARREGGSGNREGRRPDRGIGWHEAARFVSYRDKFLVDDKFTVILDKTDFGHVVGEVELEKEVTVTVAGGGAIKKEEEQQVDGMAVSQVIAGMDREIDKFMKRYEWAFPPGKPVGKLSAYFSLKK